MLGKTFQRLRKSIKLLIPSGDGVGVQSKGKEWCHNNRK